jgi:hypothetical protein
VLYDYKELKSTIEKSSKGTQPQIQFMADSNPEKDRQQMQKPNAPIIGADGNIFNLIESASHALYDAGMQEKADVMYQRVIVSGSYEEAICIIGEFVNFTKNDQS